MFILFAGQDYYPGGGWEDFIGMYESLEEAREAFYKSGYSVIKYEWGHVVDLENQVVVWQVG
jgi:hypothetical protein